MTHPRAVLLAVAVLLAGGCLQHPEELGIEIVDSVAEPVGAAPDSVLFRVTFVNLSDEGVTFEGAGRRASLDLEVRGPDGEVVWYLLPKIVGEPAIPYTVPAGATESWTVVWPVVDSLGARVDPGVYSLVGLLGDDLDVPVRRTSPHAVTVTR